MVGDCPGLLVCLGLFAGPSLPLIYHLDTGKILGFLWGCWNSGIRCPGALKVSDLTGHNPAKKISLYLLWAGDALNDLWSQFPAKPMDLCVVLLQEAWVCFHVVHTLDYCYTLDACGNVFRIKLISWQSVIAESSALLCGFSSLLFAVARLCSRQFVRFGQMVAEITASSWTTCYNLYLSCPALCYGCSPLLGAVSLT